MLTSDRTHFYRSYPFIEKPKHNILALLACNPVGSTIDHILFEWVASAEGQISFKKITTDIQNSQTREQFMLTLAALLCFQRLLPHPDSDQLVTGSFLGDFNTILNGEHLGTQIRASEYIAASLLRVFNTIEDTEELFTFLATVLGTDGLPQDLSVREPSYCNQYCKYRTESMLGHKEAFELVMLEKNTLHENSIDSLK